MTQTRTAARRTGSRRPPHLEPSGSIKLTARGAVIGLFVASLLGLLVAAWTGWTAVADAIFVISCGVVAYYTRAKGLRSVMVCPPLVFLAGAVCAQLITAPDSFSAAEGILVTLAISAPWLFIGTALTIAIAFGRGYRPKMPRSALIRRLAEMRWLAEMPRPSEMPVIGRLIEPARHLIETARHLIEPARQFLMSRSRWKDQRIRRR
jgi:hypothetical protein